MIRRVWLLWPACLVAASSVDGGEVCDSADCAAFGKTKTREEEDVNLLQISRGDQEWGWRPQIPDNVKQIWYNLTNNSAWNPTLVVQSANNIVHKECHMETENGCPLKDFTPGASYKVYPGKCTACLNSTQDYFFQVVRKDPNKLVYYMQGGGACWDRLSYDIPGACLHNPQAENLEGILDSDDSSENPYKDYTKIILMYCSGDMFAGDKIQFWDGRKLLGRPVKQHGFKNANTIFEWTKEQFSSMTDLVLGGYSAGSLGIQWWSEHLLDYFVPKYDPSTVIFADSFVGVLFPPKHMMASDYNLFTNWNMCNTGVLTDDFVWRCNQGKLLFPEVWIHAMQKYEKVMFTNIDSKADAVQIGFEKLLEATELNFDGVFMTKPEFYWEMNLIFQQYIRNDNWGNFVVTGSQHCFTNSDLMFDSSPKGPDTPGEPELDIWMSLFPDNVAGRTRSVCDGPRETVDRSGIDAATNNTLYCDEALRGRFPLS